MFTLCVLFYFADCETDNHVKHQHMWKLLLIVVTNITGLNVYSCLINYKKEKKAFKAHEFP